MKATCDKWKDEILEAALTWATSEDFEQHLRSCAICSSELDAARAHKKGLDELLPLVARGAEPPADFKARVLAEVATASEAKRGWRWQLWMLAGATAAMVVLVTGMAAYRRMAQTIPAEDLATVQKLAEWQAPSDGLLRTPGQEILKTMPRFGQSYLNVAAKTDEEE